MGKRKEKKREKKEKTKVKIFNDILAV